MYFKAYLMFREPEHLDKAHMKRMADLEWADPRVAAPETGRAMSAHFSRLLDYRDTLRPLALDEKLVAQVRSSIRQASMARIMYSGVKAKYASDPRNIDVAAQAGVNTDRVFKRKSGAKLVMPAFFGRPVFEEVTGRDRTELTRQLQQDRWVWGEGNAALGDPATISAEVTALYEQDYADAWDGFLEDLEYASFPTIGETTEALRIVASSTSPLRGLVRIVSDNTNLVQAPGGGPSVIDKFKDKAGQIKTTIDRAIGASAVPPGTIVTARFQPIHRLMVGEEDKRPIEGILGIIRDIAAQLETLGPDIAAADSVKILSDNKLRSLLLSLQQQAEGLPDNIGRLIFDIRNKALGAVNVNAAERIRTNYVAQVLPTCNQLIANRYPFERGTTVDVTLADLGRVFGNDGIFNKFFKEFLAEQVDTSGRTWTMHPGAAGIPRGMLDQFADAERIRQMFFAAGGERPSLRFSVVVMNLDSDSSRFVLRVDGKDRAQTRPGVATREVVEWPGEGAGEAIGNFESRFRPETTDAESGPWALFRMIDKNRTDAARRAGTGPAGDRESVPPGRARARTAGGANESVRRRLAAIQLRRVVGRRHRDKHGSRVLRQAPEPWRLRAPACVGRVRGCVGRVAPRVPGRQSRSAGRSMAGYLPHEPRVAIRVRAWRVRPVTSPRPDGAQRGSCRPIFPADARRRAPAVCQRLCGSH